MCLMPCRVATEFSILRATSVSIWAGAAPGRLAVTVTVGKSISMNCWTFMAEKEIIPASVSSTNSRMAGVGMRIDQAETFMGGSRQPTKGKRAGLRGSRKKPSFRNSIHHLDEIAVRQKTGSRGNDPRPGCKTGQDLHPVAIAAAQL